MFQTMISNSLGALHPVGIAYLFGYGISTNQTDTMVWNAFYYPQWMVTLGASISNGYGERFMYAAEHNLQQEAWKIFTNDFRSMVAAELPGTILATNIYIMIRGPTNEPEPGMFFIVAAGIFFLARYVKRKGMHV